MKEGSLAGPQEGKPEFRGGGGGGLFRSGAVSATSVRRPLLYA